MSNIDRQRIEAVKKLERLGFVFSDNRWQIPNMDTVLVEADAMHAMLVQCADKYDGCLEGSDEEQQLTAIAGVAEAYEAKRWPDGKIDGGKG